MIREDINEALDAAYEKGVGADGSIASAYFLEAIAKMLYFQTFHIPYGEMEEEQIEISESADIQSDL